MADNPTVHASAVLLGAKAVLIRGPSGSGKSKLAFDLILAAETKALPFARLVSDDRTFLEARNGVLLARPPAELAGLLEVRGLGIRRLPYEPVAAVGLVVDLSAKGSRLPAPQERATTIQGVTLARLGAPAEAGVLGLLLAALRTSGV